MSTRARARVCMCVFVFVLPTFRTGHVCLLNEEIAGFNSQTSTLESFLSVLGVEWVPHSLVKRIR